MGARKSSGQKPLIIIYMHKMPYPFANGTNQRILSMVNFLRNDYRVGIVIPEYHPDLRLLSKMFDYIWYGGNFTKNYGRLRRYSFRRLNKLILYCFFYNHLLKFAKNPLGKYNVLAAMTLYKVCICHKPALIIVQKVINSVLSTAIARKFGIPVIIDTHDLYKLQLEDNHQKNVVNLKNLSEITYMHEKNLLQLYDALIAIQYQEAAVLNHHFPDKKIITALHPITNNFLQQDTSHIYSSPVLLFVASASQHNIDAVEYFIKNNFDKIVEHDPGVIFNVCGDICNHISYKHKNIQLYGRVDDLTSFYEKATLVINPVRFGSGLKIKTVDALAFGKCLVTTPNGCEGLFNPEQALVCVDAERFGDKIIELLNHRALIRELEKKAHKYAADYLTSESCYAELGKLVKQLIT